MTKSLSSRRAWIEISPQAPHRTSPVSLSSRRAWIEIRPPAARPASRESRSPHGERGLKFRVGGSWRNAARVALLTESVD